MQRGVNDDAQIEQLAREQAQLVLHAMKFPSVRAIVYSCSHTPPDELPKHCVHHRTRLRSALTSDGGQPISERLGRPVRW